MTTDPHPATRADHPVTGPGEIVRVNGVDVYVRRFGDPALPPLVVIHGGPTWDHSYLLPAVAELADTAHVVLYDLRGCGRSSSPDILNSGRRSAPGFDCPGAGGGEGIAGCVAADESRGADCGAGVETAGGCATAAFGAAEITMLRP